MTKTLLKYTLPLILFFFACKGYLFSQCSGTLITPAANMTISANSYATSGTFSGTLTVNAGITLCLSGTAAIDVTILVNNGTITHTSSGIFRMSQNVTNSGTITTSNSSVTFNSIATSSSYPFTNNVGGIITIAGNIVMENSTDNYGIIQTTGGTFTKAGESRYFYNHDGGTLISYGTLRIEGNITNCGRIETTVGILSNIGTTDDLTNSAGGTIIIRGSNITTEIESNLYNYGNLLVEGNLTHTNTADSYWNYAGAYTRICGNMIWAGDIDNYSTMEVLGELKHTNTSDRVANYAGGVLNVTDDLDIVSTLEVYGGCITIGDSLYKRSNSSEDILIGPGTIFTTNFIQNDGNLTGGTSSANRGYIRVSGLSSTINGVPISGYLDLTDEGHIGTTKYFDNESPAYTYPTANVTDGGTSPCTKATLVACASSYTEATGTCATVILPIKLVEFKPSCKNGKMELSWTTATETNNDYFTIERSGDGITYDVVGIIDSKAPGGNSLQALSYSYIDNSFPKEEAANLNKVFYYRLEQTDFDGKFSYSDIQPVSCSPYCISDISVVNDNNMVFFNISSVCSANVDLVVYNALGQIVSTQRAFVETGYNNIQMNTGSIAQGLYIIKASTANQTIQKKFGVQQ